MSRVRILLFFFLLTTIVLSTFSQSPGLSNKYLPIASKESVLPQQQVTTHPASDGRTLSTFGMYLVIDLPNEQIPSHGQQWSELLNASGFVSQVISVARTANQPAVFKSAQAIVLDGSLGSANGSLVPPSLVSTLIRVDRPIILTGRAAWLCHQFRNTARPTSVAPFDSELTAAQGYENAVFLSSPNQLTVPTTISNETDLLLPMDVIQTETSCLINLTQSNSNVALPVLRYDSYPLDLFVFAPEDPHLLTSDGSRFFTNVVAYSSALRESPTTLSVSNSQAPEGTAFLGGLRYPHEPRIDAAYSAVRTAKALLNRTQWPRWYQDHQSMVHDLLNSTMSGNATEVGFKNAESVLTTDVETTSHALWLIAVMNLTSEFDLERIVNYIAGRQSENGGFDDDILVTFAAVEALAINNRLNAIDTVTLENWLRNCVIDGTKTSDPDRWGGVAQNPAGITPKNSFALAYVLSLEFLGASHNDPLKLTSWILTRTSRGDGSFSDSLIPDSEVTIGTASAITTMKILGTLSDQNKTSGLQWFTANQVPSGGFGFGDKETDLLGKTFDTSFVAICLQRLNETTNDVTSRILGYLDSVETSLGFEIMEFVPSLMWTFWLSEIARLSHSASYVNYTRIQQYLSQLNGWNQYPVLSNYSPLTSLEYKPDRYRMQSVWTQYFGVFAAEDVGYELSEGEIASTISYIIQSQDATGHFRPTSFMGTASMQHSIAAVETLYYLNALGSISNRSGLESAILFEYQNGSWSNSGWTLLPFVNIPSSIDFYSTRAALRLGILSSEMAQEIYQNIASRIQYTNLVNLGYDIATLALLTANSYPIDMSIVNTTRVLDSLRKASFNTGWYNGTLLWQPVYTSTVLRLVSILGLRPQFVEVAPCNISTPLTTSANLGSVLTLPVIVSSNTNNHSLIVHLISNWYFFSNVSDNDTLPISIGLDYQWLGLYNFSLIILDYGCVSASARVLVNITGELDGVLQLDRASFLLGEPITGNISWWLTTGSAIPKANITIRINDSPENHEWFYYNSSPLLFSLSSINIMPGLHNLTIIVNYPSSTPLIRIETFELLVPTPTCIDTTSHIDATVSQSVFINWTLRFESNGSAIENQEVWLSIFDGLGNLVYSARNTTGQFEWVPSVRGNYSFILEFHGADSLTSSTSNGTLTIFDNVVIRLFTDSMYNQYDEVELVAQLNTLNGTPLAGFNLTFLLQSPEGLTVLQNTVKTNSTGHAAVTALLNDNGQYVFTVSFDEQDFLHAATNVTGFVSWSATTLSFLDFSSEVLVNENNSILILLIDQSATPLPNRPIHIEIRYGSTTVVATYFVPTNRSGIAQLFWSDDIAGPYQITASFDGTISLGNSSSQTSLEMLIPVTLTISFTELFEVNKTGTFEVTANDHNNNPIDGLSMQLVILDSLAQIVYTYTNYTTNGGCLALWKPMVRGLYNVTVTTARKDWYNISQVRVFVDVYEQPIVGIRLLDTPLVPDSVDIEITVLGIFSDPINGCATQTIVRLDNTSLQSFENLTDISGKIFYRVTISAPGTLFIDVTVPSQGLLLRSAASFTCVILGRSSLQLTTPSQPVEQGTTTGLLATLMDWSDNPIADVMLNFTIAWNNGTFLFAEALLTSADGSCVLVFTFEEVGDFTINVTFAGAGLDGPVTTVQPQRVYVTPQVILESDPVAMVSENTTINVGVKDKLGRLIAGRTLVIEIEKDGVLIFETQIQSLTQLATITWLPMERGLARITVLHVGDSLYYTNSTLNSVSCLEIVEATLTITKTTIDFGENVTLIYSLTGLQNSSGLVTVFEVLGTDLIPLWNITIPTNSSGFATVLYEALDATGILTVRVVPAANQFLLGGESMLQLTVMTNPVVAVWLTPNPPCTSEQVNITISLENELSIPLTGVTVLLSAYDPFGESVRLGLWSDSVWVEIVNGIGVLRITLDYPGLYTVCVQFDGSPTVHSFVKTTQHILFSRTAIKLFNLDTDIHTGDSVVLTVRLTDSTGAGLADKELQLTILGPRNSIGPLIGVTNATGYYCWTTTLNDEGEWLVTIGFDGLGVYLPAEAQATIDVRLTTKLTANLINTEPPIAGVTPVNISILLTDENNVVLEGFTVTYSVFHQTIGLVFEKSLIQTSSDPLFTNFTLSQMGNYTVLINFAGTSHYYPSSTATELFVLGTSTVQFDGVPTADRSKNITLTVILVDEIGFLLNPLLSNPRLELNNSVGSVNLEDRVTFSNKSISVKIYGLLPDNYHLAVFIPDTKIRMGCMSVFEFNITTHSSIIVQDENLPLLVSSPHWLNVTAVDSLGSPLLGHQLWVQIIDPSGDEMLGNLWQNGVTMEIVLEGVIIEWTPNIAGTYQILLEFLADEYCEPALLKFSLLIRHATILTAKAPRSVQYGDDILVVVQLTGPLRPIADAPILLNITCETSNIVKSAITDWNGEVRFRVEELLANNYTLGIVFNGTDYFAPSEIVLVLAVSPLLHADIAEIVNPYVAWNTTLTLEIEVAGVLFDWKGFSNVTVIDSNGFVLFSKNQTIRANEMVTFHFVPKRIDKYYVVISIGNLPVIDTEQIEFEILIDSAPTSLTLQAETTQMMFSIPIFAVIALLFRRKIRQVYSALPTEWQ